uniref:ATP-binding protein n=1 Tax=Vaginimicrobium propionicum TaxID=1871034 RepID=UPI000970ABDD|nr:ATP-binding protein [Vaginimicrobium propionicum]
MSTLLFSLTPAQLAAATAQMIIGLLAACILTMSQWVIHRRRLATAFLLSVAVLLSFYTWAFAVVLIHSQAGIFVLNDQNFGWFVIVCLGLGFALLTTTYRYATAPLLVTLTAFLPPILSIGGSRVLLAAGAFSTSWLCVQVWREGQLLRRDLSHFSIKEALDWLEHGVLFSDSHGHNKLVNTAMDRLLESLGLTSLSRYQILGAQLRQIATDKIGAYQDKTPNDSLSKKSGDVSEIFRVTDPKKRTWMLERTRIADRRHSWTQLLALDVSEYMVLSQALSDEIEGLQVRQRKLALETARLNEALSKRLVLKTRSSIHDTIAQRISFVHRFLEDGVLDNERLGQLQQLLVNLPTDLSHNRAQIPPKVWLTTLQELAVAAELDLRIYGMLPAEDDKAHLFVQVLREAITNVLIHTASTEMEARLWEDSRGYWLEVSNPGAVATNPAYGTGLSSLESRLEAAGGSLSVFIRPRFTLRARLPH